MSDRTDSEIEQLVAQRLGGEIADVRRVAAARERVWSRMEPCLRERRASARGRVGSVAVALAAVVAVVIGVGWTQQYRVEVAQGHLPVLYREEVGRAEIRTELVTGTLVLQQRHIEGTSGLRTVTQIDVRVAGDALPANVEIREREEGSQVTGVIGQSRGLAEARPATGTTTTSYVAPLPPVAAGETRTYEVWLWVETARGTLESAHLTVEVTGRPEGERARLE